jgi:hypothetical protein
VKKERKHHHGDVRETDGRIFWGYQSTTKKSGKRYEYSIWITKEKFEARRISQNKATFLRRQNPEVKKKINIRMKNFYHSNPQYSTSKKLRERIRISLKVCGAVKSARTEELVGCSFSYLCKHLEGQFREGMSWDKPNSFHIDHIKPMSSFDLTDPQQQKAACHWSNLQPLYPEENLRKGAKILTTK